MTPAEQPDATHLCAFYFLGACICDPGTGCLRDRINVAPLDTIQQVRHMMPVEDELDPDDDEDILDPVGEPDEYW